MQFIGEGTHPLVAVEARGCVNLIIDTEILLVLYDCPPPGCLGWSHLEAGRERLLACEKVSKPIPRGMLAPSPGQPVQIQGGSSRFNLRAIQRAGHQHVEAIIILHGRGRSPSASDVS